MAKVGILDSIKRDVEKAGSSRGKIFFLKGGNKARVRFLDDMDDGRVIHVHDRWDPSLDVPCKKNLDEDADCPYCGVEGIRNRDKYCWSVWDYEANEVKIFMYPANQCSPVPGLVALYETYGTIIDRDFSVSRSGTGTDTSYAVIPLDKGKFRNTKAKAFTDKEFWKTVKDAFPYPEGEDDDDDDEAEESKAQKSKTKQREKALEDDSDWEDEDEGKYSEMKPRELFMLCKERKINAKPKKNSGYYVELLEKWDAKNEDKKDDEDDDDFWDDDEDDDEDDDLPF